GEALATPATGYSVVYHTEIGLLFLTLIALGPLVRVKAISEAREAQFGLADFPT
ncbi:PucC family protein, partial [bacterium]|nr:PucC family protein [bacterium]